MGKDQRMRAFRKGARDTYQAEAKQITRGKTALLLRRMRGRLKRQKKLIRNLASQRRFLIAISIIMLAIVLLIKNQR